MEGVALTSLWVAAMRAQESERAEPLFHDPFARVLAGDEGFAVLRRSGEDQEARPSSVVLRTRFFDEAIVAALAAGLRQVAILAAGMDARAFRMELPAGTRVFEVDQPHVLAYKDEKLASAKPTCARITVPIDLRDDWPAALEGAGFDPRARTMWIVEGLLPYLREADVTALFARIDARSAVGSELLCDVLGQSALDSAFLASRVAFVAELGAPWTFGTDEPEALLAPLGWDVRAELTGDVAARYGRWPFPRHPRRTPGLPHAFLVHAVKTHPR